MQGSEVISSCLPVNLGAVDITQLKQNNAFVKYIILQVKTFTHQCLVKWKGSFHNYPDTAASH